MINEVSDADLLAAHVNGDPHAFGELFGRHRDRLWAVALRTAGGPDDAADALQDAMVSAFRRAGSFRGEAAAAQAGRASGRHAALPSDPGTGRPAAASRARCDCSACRTTTRRTPPG